MGAQVANNATVTITTAGTRVQITSVSGVPRFVRSFRVQRAHGNSGDNVYLGGSDVASTKYIALMTVSNPDVCAVGDLLNKDAGHHNNWIDLSTYYLDASTNGDKAHVSWSA